MKITNLQFNTLFIMLFTSPFIGLELYTLLQISNNPTISILLSSIFIPLIIYIFISIFNYNPKYNIKEKLNTLFNKKISFFLILIISIYTLLFSIILFYDLNNFIISQFLSETPIYIIGLLFSVLFSILTNKEYQTTIKLSTILFFINIFLLFIILISGIKSFDINNIKPLIIDNTQYKSIIYIISFIIPIYSLLLIPKDSINKPKIIKSTLISLIFMIFITVFTISINTIYLAKLYNYPFYIALKSISLLNVFDRIENIIIVIWIFQVFISISFYINYISKLLKINNNLIVLVLLSSLLLFRNNTTFYNIIPILIPYISSIVLLIYVIIFIKIKRKNKSF